MEGISYSYFFSAQNAEVHTLVSSSTPSIALTPTKASSTKLAVSILKIAEINGDNQLRAYSINNISFTLVKVESGKNVMYNYSGKIENGADVNIVVSNHIFSGV